MKERGLVRRMFDGPIDVVGDIHGEIEALDGLLDRLGYRDGVHPSGRRLVFLGDLCDRGPDSPAVLERVRGLVESGLAQCVIGNHELNLLREDHKHGNEWFFGTREEGFETSAPAATDAHRDAFKSFFRSLPVALERDDLRVVHAAWDGAAMSLLDLKWNDIQPELYRAVKEINAARPFNITRDDVLKSLLLAKGSETRFDRLVADRGRVESLATDLPQQLPSVQAAWKSLTLLLMDECKITSERFFRGGHNSLLPFVLYFVANPTPGPAEKRRLAVAVYAALMSGVFAGAEARMGAFARKECVKGKPFPLEKLARLVAAHYGVNSLETLLSRHLDLALNIAHGGITLDNNPENLQRDHIFPRATLEKQGSPAAKTNHYANFHFLRGNDNLNKSDTAPHEWFKKPGDQPPYSDDDLKERLLTWALLQPGQFPAMLEERTKMIHERALTLFGMKAADFDALFVTT